MFSNAMEVSISGVKGGGNGNGGKKGKRKSLLC